MTKRLLACVIAAMLIGAPPAAGQRALDRVNPGTIENRETSPVKPAVGPPPTPIIAPRTSTVATGSAAITVGAITLVGLQVLKPSEFADVFETYVGRTLSPGALAGLADAIVDRARARGYPFASAWIEPQTLTAGLLRVRIDEGSVEDIRVSGNDNPAIRRALAPLIGSGPVTLKALERRLLLAGDIDGLWLKRTQFVREQGRGVLLVDVGRDRTKLQVTLANDGTKPIGPIQLQLDGAISQLFAADDSLSTTLITTPLQPSEFAYGRLRYAKRVSRTGTEVSFAGSYSTSHPGSYLNDRDISGKGWSLTGALLQPLLRSRKASVWGQASLSLRQVSQSRRDVLARSDRLSVARVGVYGFSDALGGKLRVNATLSQGLDILGATRHGDPLASRGDAGGTFTTLSMFADWTSPTVGPASVRLSAAGQVASKPLLVSEEVGLGGGSFLRAYDYSERMGDQGYMGSAEVRFDLRDKIGFVLKPQVYAFIDGGRVTNLRDGYGGGTLFSTGGGVRASITRTVQASAEIAVPLSGIRYDSGKANPVFNFRITKSF
ncbi:ShlB/FhaC/HecB family hemolysin secretion/activation protein [Sphingomonas oligophenolica]|uniref:ShlB/FhaC/HecB family hemolysin secretion/activation protein n=1 Tax=Sphingomonas oligophenolica TaxID=301154 RepID=A0A502CQA4_9SPHN|nr:ShlB/FhaC/HecB family hemolysin secretion/activation protein [Sphingomonas oligophenolica]TPG14299.1 ShlB/FhaC/HecB family hemolysin secretion/activation protein [Sphingomonas oligophenolica]